MSAPTAYDPMRRCDALRRTPAENAITLAMAAVEALPADVRLTAAVVLLGQARDLVADYVDGVPAGQPKPDNAEAVIIGGHIVIDLPIENLPQAVRGACDLGSIDGSWKVTDAQAFAKDLVRALNDEDEQGTTRVHKMFDEGVSEAIEQGAEGIEEHENDGDEEDEPEG